MATVQTALGFVRQDGKEKVTGTGRYTADLSFTGMAHAKFRYADHSHAKILKIDTARARALPGVVAVVTQADLPDVRFGGFVQDRYLFAKDVVRFEGEIVAGVAALTEEIAAEAARLIEIEYEPLPVVSDFVAAMEPGAPLVHDGLADYGKDENIVASGNTMAYHTIVKGDADAAMAGAEVVVKSHYRSDASQGVPIEPRAVVAQWQGDKVTIWSSSQVPYAARAGVAQTLEMPESDVRIIVPLLGGGFGAKCDLHFEGQVAAIARAAQRPVRLVFSREEEFTAIAQRREGISMEFETGVTRDGTLVARKSKLVLDKGAYCGEGGFLGQMAAMHACGPYQIGAISVESYLNYTNNQPSGSVRAPTAPQVCWGLEQHMDEVAAAIGMDPVELRRRTLIEEGAEGPTRQVFDKVGVKETLEKATEMIGYGRDLPEDEAIGVAIGWWPCMPAPAGAYVQMNGDGSATIVTGAQENGSGAVMAMPMFVAAELGIDPNDVSILYQDTDVAPWDMGSCGSQTTFNSGRAILAAAQEVREQLLDVAADQLEADRGRPGAHRRRRAREGVARALGRGRRPGRRDRDGPREGFGRRARRPDRRHRGLRRQARQRDVPRAAADHAGRAREGRPRDRRGAGAEGRGRARLGKDLEQAGGRRAGLRRRGDGRWARSVGGHDARRPGPPAEPAPARLQARDLLRRPGDRGRVDRIRREERGPAGLEGRR